MAIAKLSIMAIIEGKEYAGYVEVDTHDEHSCDIGLKHLIISTNKREKSIADRLKMEG